MAFGKKPVPKSKPKAQPSPCRPQPKDWEQQLDKDGLFNPDVPRPGGEIDVKGEY